MTKVLVVDDDRTLTRAIAIRLEQAGFEPFTANNAEDAGAIALHERPSLIILDVDMPPYSGLEFQACLQFSDRGRCIPVIILSGQDSDVNRRVAFSQGARDFMRKPIHWQRLIESIRAIAGPPIAEPADDRVAATLSA